MSSVGIFSTPNYRSNSHLLQKYRGVRRDWCAVSPLGTFSISNTSVRSLFIKTLIKRQQGRECGDETHAEAPQSTFQIPAPQDRQSSPRLTAPPLCSRAPSQVSFKEQSSSLTATYLSMFGPSFLPSLVLCPVFQIRDAELLSFFKLG